MPRAARVESKLLRLAIGCAPLFVALACDRQDSSVSSPTPAGLVMRGSSWATPDDHLLELLVHQDHVYVANSNYGVSALRLEDDGSLTITTPHTEEFEPRCTTLALHRASDTLYCAAEWTDLERISPRVSIFDLAEPGVPRLREHFFIEAIATRDIEVVGDRLILDHFDDGLWTAAIGPDGSLSELAQAPVEGNARSSVGVGDDRIVTLFADVEGHGAQLRLHDLAFEELDRLPLVGPPLGLSADSSGAPRVAVALGSAGLALVDVEADALLIEHELQPPAVVTHALREGDRAVAVTLSGAFAWSLADVEASDMGEGEPASLFGFAPAGQAGPDREGNMLHGVLHAGELITSDWIYVERWAIDEQGEVVDLDLPRGIYVGPGAPVRWAVRNLAPEPRRVEFRIGDQEVARAELQPAEQRTFELSPEARASLVGDERLVRMFVRVFDPTNAGPHPDSFSMIVIIQRSPEEDPAEGRPAPGDRFPPIALQADPETTFFMPTPAGGQSVFFSPDCGMIWSQLEDLAWLERERLNPREGPAVLISWYDIASDGFAERWGLWGATFGHHDVLASPEVRELNAHFGSDLYYDGFFIYDLPGDAMPSDYSVGADGIVRSVERMYYGLWTLRPE